MPKLKNQNPLIDAILNDLNSRGFTTVSKSHACAVQTWGRHQPWSQFLGRRFGTACFRISAAAFRTCGDGKSNGALCGPAGGSASCSITQM
jgi:hypothetical protein